MRAHPTTECQALLLNPTAHPALKPHGLQFIPIDHAGRGAHCLEEVDAIVTLWHNLLTQRWRDRHNQEHQIGPADILVVAPYNVQVNALRQRLPETARVGTVDKFQGQEAAVVIVSMTTSSGDDLPRDIGFLFSRNRFNVAVSRARCLALVLACPRLLEVTCGTVDDMSLVNTVCFASSMEG